MKICPNCKSEYPEDKKYCKTCGEELIDTVSLSRQSDNTIYLGILALLIPLTNLLWKINYKIFLVAYSGEGIAKMVESIGFRLSYILIFLISYSIPVLIALKVKNKTLKILAISFSSILFVMEALSQISTTLNWNSFWYRP